MVPKGNTPSVLSNSVTIAAIELTVPSPPPATITSASLRTARSASLTTSTPLQASSILASTPIALKAFARCSPTSAFEPVPELVLIITSIFTRCILGQTCSKTVAREDRVSSFGFQSKLQRVINQLGSSPGRRTDRTQNSELGT